MKATIITLVTFLVIAIAAMAFLGYPPSGKKIKAKQLAHRSSTFSETKFPNLKMIQKAVEARDFVNKKDYNKDYYFLVDLGMPSNQKRFFVYDLKKDSILKSGLVTHGNCNKYRLEKIRFDNTVGCGCSSLGKFKIGYSYYGRFGLAFKLNGLDKTNSNAFKRYIVLHSHECVPDFEVEDEICQSNGCPTVSPNFLKELDPMIKDSKKPVLLWIVN